MGPLLSHEHNRLTSTQPLHWLTPRWSDCSLTSSLFKVHRLRDDFITLSKMLCYTPKPLTWLLPHIIILIFWGVDSRGQGFCLLFLLHSSTLVAVGRINGPIAVYQEEDPGNWNTADHFPQTKSHLFILFSHIISTFRLTVLTGGNSRVRKTSQYTLP